MHGVMQLVVTSATRCVPNRIVTPTLVTRTATTSIPTLVAVTISTAVLLEFPYDTFTLDQAIDSMHETPRKQPLFVKDNVAHATMYISTLLGGGTTFSAPATGSVIATKVASFGPLKTA